MTNLVNDALHNDALFNNWVKTIKTYRNKNLPKKEDKKNVDPKVKNNKQSQELNIAVVEYIPFSKICQNNGIVRYKIRQSFAIFDNVAR